MGGFETRHTEINYVDPIKAFLPTWTAQPILSQENQEPHIRHEYGIVHFCITPCRGKASLHEEWH
jgi:hypothetical protein